MSSPISSSPFIAVVAGGMDGAMYHSAPDIRELDCETLDCSVEGAEAALRDESIGRCEAIVYETEFTPDRFAITAIHAANTIAMRTRQLSGKAVLMSRETLEATEGARWGWLEPAVHDSVPPKCALVEMDTGIPLFKIAYHDGARLRLIPGWLKCYILVKFVEPEVG